MHMMCLLQCLVLVVSKDLILAFTCTRFSNNGFLVSGAKFKIIHLIYLLDTKYQTKPKRINKGIRDFVFFLSFFFNY